MSSERLKQRTTELMEEISKVSADWSITQHASSAVIHDRESGSTFTIILCQKRSHEEDLYAVFDRHGVLSFKVDLENAVSHVRGSILNRYL